MKKSKIIILAASLLLAVMLFSSCSLPMFIPFGSIDMAQLIDETKYVDDNVVFGQCTELEDLEDAVCVSTVGDLALYTSVVENKKNPQTKYIVYNYATGASYTTTSSKTTLVEIYLDSIGDNGYFIVVKTKYEEKNLAELLDPDVTTEFYNADCSYIAETDELAHVGEVGNDLVCFADKYYRVKDGIYTYAFDKDVFAKDMDGHVFAQTDEYYYVSDEGTFSVYDKNLKFVSMFAIPSYAYDSKAVVLGNGDIFVQYLITEDLYTEDYDVMLNGAKYDVCTVAVNPATGDATDVLFFDYLMMSGEIIDDDAKKEAAISDEINNFVVVCPIADKRVDSSVTNYKVGTITDISTFKPFELDGKAAMPMEIISADLYVIATVEGQHFLVDAEGNVKADVTNMSYEYNDKYIIKDGKIYNYSLNVLYDYEEDDLEVEQVFDASILFKGEDNELVLFVNDNFVELIDAKNDELELDYVTGDCFVIKDTSDNKGKVNFVVYNENGEEITEFKNCVSVTVDGEEKYAIVTVVKIDTKKGEVVSYYKLH